MANDSTNHRNQQANETRNSAIVTGIQTSNHQPIHPSGLRNSRLPSTSTGSTLSSPPFSTKEPGMTLQTDGHLQDHEGQQANVRTRLFDQRRNGIPISYGTDNARSRSLSPRPATFRSTGSSVLFETGLARFLPNFMRRQRYSNIGDDSSDDQDDIGIATELATKNGKIDRRWVYIYYYFPFANWIRQYRWSFLRGDLISALTIASFYLPMSLSYAANLGHIPPINGLYSFAFSPFVYALFGTCPQMVVGPEAAGSLLTGQVVRENISRGQQSDDDDMRSAQIAGVVTGLAGAIILLAGLCRLGFLDSVLSRPFLRGFISAIGIVIFVDQLVSEMGLDKLATHGGSAAHGSSLDKIIYIFNNARYAHALTCAVSLGAFSIVMTCRELKKQFQPRRPWVAYIPDRFLVVAMGAFLTWIFDWESKGLAVLGDIKAGEKPFAAAFPFRPTTIQHATDAFGTAVIIALLGFFESSVAAKSLGDVPTSVTKPKSERDDRVKDQDAHEEQEPSGITDMMVSPNRELVALGLANILGGIFMALPAFGGYGRSKVNASTGGKTPMSSVFLSLLTIFCILFALPYFYYIPRAILSAMISVVAYSLIEEAPHDISFFWKISGYSELFLMLLIFLTTFFWNLRIGIFVGISLSLVRLLRHSTRPRIQILGRVPGTRSQFENAEIPFLYNTHTSASTPIHTPIDQTTRPLLSQHQSTTSVTPSLIAHQPSTPLGLEFLENTLIIKIPEPLTFANTGSLKHRLRRIEDHGTSAAHPALPRVRSPSTDKLVIFDVHGVTSLDPAAAQVLLEIVTEYRKRDVGIYFCRVLGREMATPRGGIGEVWRLMVVSGIVEVCGGEGRFVGSVEEALDLFAAERGGLGDYGRSNDVDSRIYERC